MKAVRVLAGTKKGAFILTSDARRSSWTVDGPFFGGWEIYHMKGSPWIPTESMPRKAVAGLDKSFSVRTTVEKPGFNPDSRMASLQPRLTGCRQRKVIGLPMIRQTKKASR